MASEIFKAIPAILADVEAIGKNRTNKQQGFAFRGIDDVMNTLHPLFAKHKVFPTCEVSEVTRSERETKSGGTMFVVTLKAKYTLHAEDGSNVCTEAAGEAMDSADKATNKALSSCYKYAMFQLLCIPTEAVDADAETPEPVRPAASKPAPALTADELAYVNDCTQAIAAAATEQDLLTNVGQMLPTKSQAIRDSVRPLYTKKLQTLRQSTAA
jgi:hypothetical protein